MKKRVTGIIVSVIVCILIVFSVCSRVIHFKGVITEEQESQDIEVAFKTRNFNRFLYKVFKSDKLAGTVSFQLKDRETVMEYKLVGPVLETENFCFVNVMGYDGEQNEMVSADLYLDRKLKNFVLTSDSYEIYAADKKFCDLVKKSESR